MRQRFDDDSGRILRGYGPTAVVTGASRGIGFGFAKELARLGFDLILTDVDPKALENAATRIRGSSSSSIACFAADMTDRIAPSRLVELAQGEQVGLLVCNHLVPGERGSFLDGTMATYDRELDANVRAYVELIWEFSRRMRTSGRGGIVIMSSMTAVVGSPYVTSYGAAKAYLLALGSGLGFELQGSGVDILTLVPGAVNTETFREADQGGSGVFKPMEVDEFVVDALQALGRKPDHTPGRTDAITRFLLGRVLSRRRAVALLGQRMRTMLAGSPIGSR